MNTSFIDLKKGYKNGTVTKPDFIRCALEFHRTLFEYAEITRSTDVREILITEDGVSFVLGDERIRLFCPVNEARVAPIEVMNFERYEPDETRVMDMLVEDSQNILDVGANIGLYSIRFAKRIDNAKVFSFEPMPISHAFLQKNVAVNGVGTRVTTFNYGLSEVGGVVEFFISPAASTNASLKNVAGAVDAACVTGLTLTLDQWVSNQKIAPDFIKCDVEGAELLVFRGGRATLDVHKPIVFAELLRKWSSPFGYHPNDMINFFFELGYICFAVGGSGVRRITEVTDDTPETNYAFLHIERHGEKIKRMDELK